MRLTDRQLRHLRLRAQGLLRPEPDAPRTPAGVAGAMLGAQAQDAAAGALSLHARTTGLLHAAVESARVEERSLVRTWCMRSTLHLVAADDLRWLLPLLGPVFISAQRRRREQLGWDEAASARGLDALRTLLSERGPCTRSEIAERLASSHLPAEGQAVPHLLGLAALRGLVCEGTRRGSQPAYVLLEDWIAGWPGRSLPRDVALAQLARRYTQAFGPATSEDLAAWSGLPLRDARAGWAAIAGELLEVETENGRAALPASRAGWLDEPLPEQPPVQLLPRFDTYLLGYRDRRLTVPAEHAHRVHPGGGILHATVLVDGVAVGTWRTSRRGRRVEIAVQPFSPLPDSLLEAVQTKVDAIGRFEDREAVLTIGAVADGS